MAYFFLLTFVSEIIINTITLFPLFLPPLLSIGFSDFKLMVAVRLCLCFHQFLDDVSLIVIVLGTNL